MTRSSDQQESSEPGVLTPEGGPETEAEVPDGPAGREEVVEAVLRAARDLIAERGPSGVSLREIAREAGVNNGLVYLYIGTKAELVAEVYRRAALDMATRMSTMSDLGKALDLLMYGGDGSDTKLMAWAALDEKGRSAIFEPAASLESLAHLYRSHAPVDMSAEDARIAAALAAMISTAWRVFGPVARISAGLPDDRTPEFDDAVRALIGSLGD